MIRQISVAAIAAVFGCASAYAARPPVHEAARSNLDLSFPTATAAVGGRSLGLEGAPAKARKLLSSQRRLGSVGLHSSFNEALGTPSFLWARAGLTASAPLSLQRKAMVEYGGRDALGKQASLLGIHQADIDSARLVQLHDRGGAIVTAYQQRAGGYDVFGRRLAVAMSQQFRVVATAGSFAPLSASDRLAASVPVFDWSAPRAIAAAFADLGGSISPGLIRPAASAGDYTLHSVGSTGRDYRIEGGVRSKPVLFPLDGRLLPAYYTEVRAATADGHRQDYYGYVISAVDGQVLFRKNLTQHDAFTYRALADTGSPFQPFDHPLGNETFPVPSLDPNTVYVRSPASSAFVSVENSPIDGVAVARPWLAAGATVTSGNNVDAYADLNSPDGLNGSDFRAAVTSPGVFDYPIAIDTTPTTTVARNAAIVNLFYMNNWLHDFWYGAGFDEAAGNAQSSNFGLGGVAGDPIHAEGQDFSGTNNANMSTPADGGSPRMQMYLFDGIFDGALTVVTPALGDLAVAPAAFGAGTFDLTDEVAAYLDGSGSATDACEAATNAAALAGKIALIDRGSCDFVVKVKNAQDAGAVGAIVADNVPGEKPFTMGGEDASITIPALMTSFEDGASLRDALADGTVTVHMLRNASTPLDGTLDNGIIAHEFFHYVSNRLVNDGSGLLNNQGGSMGEGWGDFSALMLAVRAEDSAVAGNEQYQGAYSMGYYVLDDLYFGIRRAPYSTSFAVNPLTFEHIENGVPLPATAPFGFGTDGASNAEVHNAGEVWAVTLWEAYAALLNNPLYSFTEAQSRMKRYVIEGLMMTPTNPTFLEARDAILAVAEASDAVDFELISKAFARRGMGVYAVAPPAGSINHAGVVQSFVAAAPTVAAAEAYLDLSGSPTPDDNCDSDPVLDLGEVARFVLRLPINGSVALSDGTLAQVSSADPVILGNDGGLDLQPDGSGYLEGEISIALSAATGSVELTVALPEVGDAATVVFGNGEPAFTAATHYDLALDLAQDGMETAATPAQWSTARSGNSAPWQLTDFDTTTGFGWWAPSSDELAEQYLTSPAIDVTTIGPFALDFDHYYAYSEVDSTGEVPVGLDGGVIEVSVDGAAWQDVQTLGTFTAGGYTGLITTPDGNREGYVGTNRVQSHVSIDFGSNVAGSTIRLRFRTFSDDGVGNFGWLVDNVAAGDAAYPPFGSVVAENGVCSTAVPTASAGNDFTVPAIDAVSGQPTVVKLTGTASDADEDADLAYSWTRIAGPEVVLSGADTLTPTFTAPQLEANTSLTFQLAVTDGATEVFDTVTVKIVESKPPVASAGTDQLFTGPVTVTLDGSGSSDPSGEAVTLLWTQTAGPAATLSDPTSATPSFTTNGGNYTFVLTVTDPQGNQATDSVNVLVHIPPSATAPADFAQDERVAGTAQLSTVTLTGIANDPEDTDTYTYLWQQVGGTPTVTLINAGSKVASFTAPAVKSDTPLTFRFAVQGKEKVSSDDVTVTIKEVDVAPVANAGPAQSLSAIVNVQLDGSASSDPDGTLSAYAWSQTGGPAAVLSDAAVPKPTFTATLGGAYVFALTVTDDEGLSNSSSVTITVANPAPVVNAGTDSTVLVGTIALNGSATDANGTVATYAWARVDDGPPATIADADKASASFTATSPGVYRFRLTATDNEGTSSANDVVVTVQSAPTASAGADASATTGTMVTLDGSGSTDVDGDIAYAWTAVSGPTVSLVNATSEQASFTPSAAGTYVFKLVVTDDDGLTDEDQVTITVTAAPSSGGGGGGGAAGGLLIAVMLAGAALRRRQRAG